MFIQRPRSFGLFFLTILLSFSAVVAFAQSQAINGQIEGVVTDANGAAIPNVKITATNLETGTVREVTSDASGVYRVPLLPLGTYKIVAEAASFKRLSREGVTLTTGQTATVDLKLETGGITEQVTITSDAPIADTAKIDLGRVMNTREVTNLPLVSRNPYNFSLLQANVTGRPNSEFGVPRINANGFARRTNYQLDGNNNTQTDRAGIRLMPISELFVSEVQLVTNGFAPEFGNTPGLIMNAVTPSGTNQFHGSGSYRLRRTPFAARPFFFGGTTAPPAILDNYNGAVGGPLVRDRWHFYTGYEHVKRELGGEPARVVNITEANKTALIASGIPASAFPANIPTSQNVTFLIGRTDVQVDNANRLLGRYIYFRNNSPDNIGGNLNTLQRSIDFKDASDSVGIQLVSIFSPTILNELRYQYARRYSQNLSNNNSGQGLTLVISGVANFGAPTDDLVQPLQVSNQVINNTTITKNNHTMKFGGGFNFIRDERRSRAFAQYTFANLQAYLDAKSGLKPFGYTQYREAVGDPFIAYNTEFYHAFAQDDWKITPRLKVNYGVRYDLYNVPNAFTNSPLSFSQNFKLDKNNFAPRLGIVYGLHEGNRPTVLRASAGIYYDPPLIDMYRRGLQNNGSPIFATSTFNITGGVIPKGAPAFPNTLALAAGTTFSASTIEGVSPDFKTMSVFHTNLQLEQALSQNYSVTLGFIHSQGSHLPVYRDINMINPTSTLADGRPVYSSTVSAATRLYPAFNNILLAESVGNSNYTAGVLSLNKRFAKGYQFSANYTWSHSIDDAPEQNVVAATAFSQSDPTNRRRDRGNSLADQRHTFVFSFVGKPTFNIQNKFVNRLVNDNQLGIVTTANSGENFNIVSNLNLNGDGITGSDRPLFIGRNTGRLPKQVNVDLRYSRFITFTERYRAEILGEFVNVFNKRSIFSVNSTVTTDATGTLSAALPDFTLRSPSALDARIFQLGFKFNF